MTFLQIVQLAKNKYQTTNDVVIFEIIYKFSNKVKTKINFINNRNEQIDFNQQTFFKCLNQYFLKQKPLGQIIKSTRFCKLDIKINNKIFEPRKETEELTYKVISYIKHNKKLKNGADLCCGTGCIGIAIKKYCPWCNITMVDINKNAIKNTKENAKKNDVIVKSYIGDFYRTLISKKIKLDFVVCNPPYVDKNVLNKDMIKYETMISFTNSKDNLFFYKTLILNMNKILTKNGMLFFEIGYDMKEKLLKILKKHTYQFFNDINGITRFLFVKNTI